MNSKTFLMPNCQLTYSKAENRNAVSHGVNHVLIGTCRGYAGSMVASPTGKCCRMDNKTNVQDSKTYAHCNVIDIMRLFAMRLKNIL